MTSGDAAAVTIGSPHVYEPLQPGSIRLVKILPNLSEDPRAQICCQTACFRLEYKLDYTALSYAWGSAFELDQIVLDGQEFLVPRNLYSFLRRARNIGGCLGWLWIDSISINQSNNAERTHQVASMSTIYSNASLVVIWLGPRSGNSDSAMRLLYERVRYLNDPHKLWDMWKPRHNLAFKRLLERPYWSRLWVFQEVTLARHKVLMCGGRRVDWDSLADFVWAWERMDPIPEVAMWSSLAVHNCPGVSMVKHAARVGKARPLWDLMFALKHLGCADPRDKVYALLGVAAQTRATIEPDYTMSVGTLAHAVLKHEHELKPRQDTDEVAKQCGGLEGLLGLHKGEMLVMVGQHRRLSNADLISSDGFCLGDAGDAGGIGLGWAVFQGHDAVVELYTREPATDDPSRYLEAILDLAVYQGNHTLVETLLSLRIIRTNHHLHMRVRCHDNDRPTSFLDTAVRYGHVGVARKLLETGHYDVNAHLPRVLHGGREVCPLHLAAQQCDVAMVEMLMTVQGINVHHRCGGRKISTNAVTPANFRCKPSEDTNTSKALLDLGKGLALRSGVLRHFAPPSTPTRTTARQQLTALLRASYAKSSRPPNLATIWCEY
ncbi:hypothetical protein LTR17_003554 [Elasticomyces elasticus]|nr:hypothetical protein LTR17_003554 [Elasticomyces elasticus]